MLTPQYLQRVPASMVELYGEAEAAILADMARRINGYDMFIPAAQHQLRVLEEMGAAREGIMGQLAKLTRKSNAELEQIMAEAGMKAVRADDMIYRAAGLSPAPLASSKVMQRTLQAGLTKTRGVFDNLTRTTASTASRQFEKALDAAYMKVTTGGFSPQEAVTSAIKDLCRQGLTAIEYPSGHRDSLDVAVRRAVVTGVNQTALQMQVARADELGVDLVETTAHAGARPYHAEWQGKIFSRSGRSSKYPDFVSATGYGTGEGLGGWNCSHSFRPYIEGMPRTYSKELLEQYEAKDYEYNGKKMTEYEALQQQRQIERNIRRWKRENLAMEAAGKDTAESAGKLHQWQAAEKDFLAQTGLKKQNSRSEVSGWGRSQAVRASAEGRRMQQHANELFGSDGPQASLKKYLRDKTTIDTLDAHGVKYIRRISGKEILVDAGRPTIKAPTAHAMLNQQLKPDRAGMSIEAAQQFVDTAKLTVYQDDNETLKFIAGDGYAVLNFDHKLVTAVPQKWRRKYDKYLEEG